MEPKKAVMDDHRKNGCQTDIAVKRARSLSEVCTRVSVGVGALRRVEPQNKLLHRTPRYYELSPTVQRTLPSRTSGAGPRALVSSMP
jgi:hypothetical protein